MTETGRILLGLLVVFVSAKIAAEVFERLHQPAVVGELLVGMLIGPYTLGLVRPDIAQQTVAALGVVLLMFTVGLQTKVSDLFRVGRRALIVAALGVVLDFAVGFAFSKAMGYPLVEALFVSTAIVSTSVGITARVLAEAGLLETHAARIILAAAVIDDVFGLLVLSIVTGVGRGRVDLVSVLVAVGQAVAFIAFQLLVVPRLVRSQTHWFDRLRISYAPLTIALATMLLFAALAERVGLAAIVGAFFAGMAFAETAESYPIAQQTRPLYAFLVPFFFVNVGMRVDLNLLRSPAVLGPAIVLTVLAALSKVVGCGLGALPEGRRTALAIGFGMIPRGEVGLIVAAVGLTLHAVRPNVYAIVVLVSVLTTSLVPPFLPALFRRAGELPGPPLCDEELPCEL